jgi:hypothetical protein
MFMQYLKNKKSIFFALAVFISLNSIVSAQQKPKSKSGEVIGAIAFVNDELEAAIRYSPKTSIILSIKGQKKTIVSDENGFYIITLPVGMYCIFSIESEDGTPLKLWQGQPKCFKISKNKNTRFDINLLE